MEKGTGFTHYGKDFKNITFLKNHGLLGNPAGWEEPLEVRVGLKAGPAQPRLLKSCSIVNNSMDGDSKVAI